ncbi:MerR family transcriptional regulator [Fusobacterium sp. IOR10]|uniref:MerR family transcriptional regulator n=1 Tax=Fusobacterium sp. IOR10 TaxID=2665157 RepID=UPI0013D86560|nr:MerR family transcriptional regulator [Fusobacterium sp. IOR10]
MLEKIKKTFTVSEMANILKINKNTVLYYDKEGIVKARRKENNYRYYTLEHIRSFKRALFLREMNFSIKEILDMKNKLDKRQENFKLKESDFYAIDEKIKEIKIEIKCLLKKIKFLKNRKKYLRFILQAKEKLGIPYIIQEEERKGIVVDININLKEELEAGNLKQIELVKKIEKVLKEPFILGKHVVGYSIDKNDYLNSNYISQKFLILRDKKSLESKVVLEKGEYLVYYVESDSVEKNILKKLLLWIKNYGYEIRGNIFVECINEIVRVSEDSVQIRIIKIPIKKLTSE